MPNNNLIFQLATLKSIIHGENYILLLKMVIVDFIKRPMNTLKLF